MKGFRILGRAAILFGLMTAVPSAMATPLVHRFIGGYLTGTLPGDSLVQTLGAFTYDWHYSQDPAALTSGPYNDNTLGNFDPATGHASEFFGVLEMSMLPRVRSSIIAPDGSVTPGALIPNPLCGGPSASAASPCAYGPFFLDTNGFGIGNDTTRYTGEVYDGFVIAAHRIGVYDLNLEFKASSTACLSDTDISPILAGQRDCVFDTVTRWWAFYNGYTFNQELVVLQPVVTQIGPIPEPPAVSLLLLGLVALGLVRQRRA